jgi:hypothetical protein
MTARFDLALGRLLPTRTSPPREPRAFERYRKTVEEDDEGRRATDDKRVDEHAQRLHEALLDRVRNVGGGRGVGGAAAARDVRTRMHPLTYTAPGSKADYVGGRFLAAFVLKAGNCTAAILLEPAVLYIPSTIMYNAAMYIRVSSLAPRDA